MSIRPNPAGQNKKIKWGHLQNFKTYVNNASKEEEKLTPEEKRQQLFAAMKPYNSEDYIGKAIFVVGGGGVFATTPGVSPSPTPTPSITPTITQTISLTPTSTPTPTITLTPTITPTISLTPTNTPTPSATPAAGLLNTYPNASVAYSLRLLRNGYSGNSIRVRRSSDNAEQDIGFSGGNLDTTSLNNFITGSTNGFITTWYDQSGNANNAVQTSATSQPIIVSGGTILTLSGTGVSRPVLRFDGTNDWMDLTTIVNSDVHTSAYPQKKASADISAWMAGVNGTPFTPVIFQTAGIYITNQPTTSSNGAINNTNYILLSGTKPTGSGSAGTIRINNSNQTLATSNFLGGNNQFTQIQRRGTTDYSKCDVPEMIMWASNLESDLTNISIDINTYYQIY
jgi:hypothetical protein